MVESKNPRQGLTIGCARGAMIKIEREGAARGAPGPPPEEDCEQGEERQ